MHFVKAIFMQQNKLEFSFQSFLKLSNS